MLATTLSTTPKSILLAIGLPSNSTTHYQLSAEELTQQTLLRGEGALNDTGALVVNTGAFTGRSPDDKFIVKDALTADTVDWNKFNNPIEAIYFDKLHAAMMAYLGNKEIWIRDCMACADETYQLRMRIVNENPWCNLFAYNMFLRPDQKALTDFKADWLILHGPGFSADPSIHGVRHPNFTIINFSKKIILIGGSGYTGEIKKGIFSVLNYILPNDRNVLSMHCAANMGASGDTAIFFGLSGTGKTTLSADPKRFLIGDDEHGWTANSVFNFEGGCYAKTINLSVDNEPEIFKAIRPGALVENVTFIEGRNQIDFSSDKITENTRVSYPLHFISNAVEKSIGKIPRHIFFLTCDCYGILPPISKLSVAQAMYQFISGYTAKIAGTENGITEPKATFSACFGAPFLPLNPIKYATLLGEKLKDNKVNVWLVNTGWSGGEYGVGKRIKLKDTRAMISAALEGKLQAVDFITHSVFGFQMPVSCEGVAGEILNPKNTWQDKQAYDSKARQLAQRFVTNFEQYKRNAGEEILAAAPKTQ